VTTFTSATTRAAIRTAAGHPRPMEILPFAVEGHTTPELLVGLHPRSAALREVWADHLAQQKTQPSRIATALADTIYLALPDDIDALALYLEGLTAAAGAAEPFVDGVAVLLRGNTAHRDGIESVLRESPLTDRGIKLTSYFRPAPDIDQSVGGVNLGPAVGRPLTLTCSGQTGGRNDRGFPATVALWQLLSSLTFSEHVNNDLGRTAAGHHPAILTPSSSYSTIDLRLRVDDESVADAECVVRETLAALSRPTTVWRWRESQEDRDPASGVPALDDDLRRGFARVDELLFPPPGHSIWTMPQTRSDTTNENIATEARRMLATYTVRTAVNT